MAFDPAVAERVHNKKENGNDAFKLFGFSKLQGKPVVKDNTLIYEQAFCFEIRATEQSKDINRKRNEKNLIPQTVEKVAETTRIYKSEYFFAFLDNS